MKKIISTLAASLMAVSAFTSVSVSASNVPEINKYTISTSTIENDTVVDETTIPAGSVAITVNINNNYGFSSSATKLNVGISADIVIDESGRPVITKGNVLDDFITASAVKDGTVVVSSASDKETNTNGEMFTIYVANDYSGASVEDITNESISIKTDDIATPFMNTRYEYYIGDISHNGYINSIDASQLLGAIEDFKEKYPAKDPTKDFTVDFADAHLSEYFPDAHYANVADTNKNNLINKADVNNILQFYSYVATGYTREEAYDELSVEEENYCGEQIVVVEKNE